MRVFLSAVTGLLAGMALISFIAFFHQPADFSLVTWFSGLASGSILTGILIYIFLDRVMQCLYTQPVPKKQTPPKKKHREDDEDRWLHDSDYWKDA